MYKVIIILLVVIIAVLGVFLFMQASDLYKQKETSTWFSRKDDELAKKPYYFIAIHNEPFHYPNKQKNKSRIADDYLVLRDMVEYANTYNIKLTIMLSAQWADYIVEDPDRFDEVLDWRKQGHEIAGHHHSIYHGNWDGYTNYSKEEAESERARRGGLVEKYLGTLDDYIVSLKRINPDIKAGCMNDEADKRVMPDAILYDTCSGWANYGTPGRPESDLSSARKGINEYVSVGKVNGITRKWLAHYQVTKPDRVDMARQEFVRMNSGVYGAVVHSFSDQADPLYDWMDFLHTQDPKAERNRTVSQIIEEGLLPEKSVAIK